MCRVCRPFPKLWLVSPDDRGQIVCDYELSRWAVALHLARCRRHPPPSPTVGRQTLFPALTPPHSPAPAHAADRGGGDNGNGTPETCDARTARQTRPARPAAAPAVADSWWV